MFVWVILILTMTSGYCERTGEGIEKLFVSGFNNVSSTITILPRESLPKKRIMKLTKVGAGQWLNGPQSWQSLRTGA